ncbi:sugar ABC transporter substrate-binding protein [Bacillus sp. ISL-55]|uniref:ABC transporter substrate-binding protein n=1 Tax=Bacillus sp. ISL-55 TaxID=2819134 RepID=UPI001BEAD31C|nr:sugar ABC transporter substrate-binding protein [Bacillus sp. ISL-55]MBT2692567.1 sugar ABC transporter substrate-binding protein [Bacillus sp. ISL-55]
MKKKLSVLLMLVLLVSSFMAGCSSKESSGEGDGGDKKISFIHWRGEDSEVFKELISRFEKENPGIKVEMTAYPSEQYQSTAQTLLRDGSTGDVFTAFPGSQFEIIKKAGLFEDLTGDDIVGNFNENLIAAGEADGKQLALPFQLVYNQPVYNKTLFKELGIEPPDDWEGFLAMNEKLKENGYTPIAFPGADIGPGQFMNSMMMNNAPDEEIFAKLMNGEAKLTDEWWVKTLTQFQELMDKGYFGADALGTKHEGAIAQVAQGKAAMLATGSYAMANIQELNPDIELGLLAPITVSADEAEYEGIHTTTFMFGVNSKSKNKEEAKKFINFLTQPENAEYYANKTGQFLTIPGVNYESEALKAAAEWSEKKTRFQPRYLIPNADVEKAVIASIQSVLGGEDPKKAAEAAQKIVDQNIK